MSSLFSASFTDSKLQYNKGKWSPAEDDLLRLYVEKFGEKKWKKISDLMLSRSPLQCLHRWTKILKPGMIKGPWTIEEDQKLIQWVRIYGPNKWSLAAKMIPGRNGKQCRERWINHLNPEIKKGNWTEAEDEKIYQLYQQYGSAWSKIARYFIGRSENSIKNRFYATLRKFDHLKKRSEFLSQVKSEDYLSAITGENMPETKVEPKENNRQGLFPEQLSSFNMENKWATEEIDELLCCKLEPLSSSLDDSGSCNKSPICQNNVLEVLNDIMEDDRRLDTKILTMIESLKNIELEIMSKIAKSFQEEKVCPDLKRNYEDSEEDEEEYELLGTKKIRLI